MKTDNRIGERESIADALWQIIEPQVEPFRHRFDLRDLSALFARMKVVLRRPARPGRRPDARITAAYADWKAGRHIDDICAKHVPHWATLNPKGRKVERGGLLDAFRKRNRAAARAGQTD